MHEMYSRLKGAFGLADKHILILQFLEKEKLNAKQVADKTGIPYGRIYDYLNQLIEFELIEKTPKKPYKYFVTDFKENVIGFMRDRIEHQLKAQTEVIHLLSSNKGTEHVEIISNSEEFTNAHINMISEASVFKMVGVHDSFPYLLYPNKFEDWLSLRKVITAHRATLTHADLDTALLIYRTYMDALRAGKKLVVVFEKTTFDKHMKLIREKLGRDFLRKMIKDNLEKFGKYKAEVHIIDEYTTMQIDINEIRVNLCLKFLGVVKGILMLNKDVVKFFDAIYEQNLKKSKPVEPILKKMLKQL